MSYNGRIINGDCIEEMDRLEPESIKTIITSPPYNIRNTGKKTPTTMKFREKKSMWDSSLLADGYDGYDDFMPHNEYVDWQRNVLNSMMRVLRPDGAIFYNHKWRVQGGLLQGRQDIVEGFPVRQIIIWNRISGINFQSTHFLPSYEVIYFICKPDFRLQPKMNAMTDVWTIMPEHKNEHPAPFPIELPMKCIKASGEGIVLDPFMGSGTTAMAAEKLGMPWIGIEQSQTYCDKAHERISSVRRNKKLTDFKT